MNFAGFGVGYDADGNERLFMSGYGGQIFKFDRNVLNDAVPSGLRTGSFVATQDSYSGLTTATGLYTTGVGLANRWITIVDAENRPFRRAKITSNGAATILFESSLVGFELDQTYTWFVGGADFRLYTKWFDMDQPFLQKRFDRVYIQAQSNNAPTGIYVSTHVNFVDEEASAENTVDLGGDNWDEGFWDTAIWAGQTQFKKRLGVFKNTTALRVVVLHNAPEVDLRVSKIGVLGRLLSDRIYT